MQIPEIQTAKIQTSEMQIPEIQTSELPNSVNLLRKVLKLLMVYGTL